MAHEVDEQALRASSTLVHEHRVQRREERAHEPNVRLPSRVSLRGDAKRIAQRVAQLVRELGGGHAKRLPPVRVVPVHVPRARDVLRQARTEIVEGAAEVRTLRAHRLERLHREFAPLVSQRRLGFVLGLLRPGGLLGHLLGERLLILSTHRQSRQHALRDSVRVRDGADHAALPPIPADVRTRVGQDRERRRARSKQRRREVEQRLSFGEGFHRLPDRVRCRIARKRRRGIMIPILNPDAQPQNRVRLEFVPRLVRERVQHRAGRGAEALDERALRALREHGGVRATRARERAQRDGQRVTCRGGAEGVRQVRQRVQLNQKANAALLHELLRALVRGKHRVHQTSHVGDGFAEKRWAHGRRRHRSRARLLLAPGRRRRRFGVRIHGRLARGSVGARLGVLVRIPSARLHETPQNVDRQLYPLRLQRRDVSQQLVQVPTDGRRRLPLHRAETRARGERAHESVQRRGRLDPFQSVGRQAQRAEGVREAAERIRRRNRSGIVPLPRVQERLRHALRVEFRITRGFVVHHVAEQVRGEGEDPGAEQPRVREDEIQRAAQRAVLESRHLDVDRPGRKVRQRERAHQRLEKDAPRGRHEVHGRGSRRDRRRLTRSGVAAVRGHRRRRSHLRRRRRRRASQSRPVRRGVFRERVLRLEFEPLDENLHASELAERGGGGGGVIHENLQHVHRVTDDVHVARVSVAQQRHEHGQQTHVAQKLTPAVRHDQRGEQRDERLGEGHGRVRLFVDGVYLEFGQLRGGERCADGRARRLRQPRDGGRDERRQHRGVTTAAHRGYDTSLVRTIVRQRREHAKRRLDDGDGNPLALQSQHAEEFTDKLGLRFREEHEAESIVRGGVRGGVRAIALEEDGEREETLKRRLRRLPALRR